jgi:hypothetical protein
VNPRYLLCLVVLALGCPLPSLADAELLGIDSTQRVHGSFFVSFKTEAELGAIPKSGVGAPLTLPNVQPTTLESTKLLVEALCNQMHPSRCDPIFFEGSPNFAGFMLHDAPDDAIRGFLAKDPRISKIGANFPLTPVNPPRR